MKDYKKVAITCLAFLMLFSVGCGSSTPSAPSSQQSTSTQQQQKPEQPSVKVYKSGHYKVGTDIPAGEYVGLSKGDAYIEVAKDSKGTLDSIIANDIFTNRTIITVSNGQYIKTQGCDLYAFKDAPKVQSKDGFLLAGMYKVGVDLPAGEYKVVSERGDSYIEVSSGSAHILDEIISNDLFQGERYIEVSDGQYLKTAGAKIKLK